MNKHRLIQSFFTATVLLFISITTHAEPANLGQLKIDLEAYHDTGAYDKELKQVAQQAEAYITTRAQTNAKAEKPLKLAIILDIDETTLSNYKGIIERKFCENQEKIDRDIKKANAPAIAPMLALYQDARRKKVAVFFVTGRRSNLKKATEKNLTEAGYTTWNGIYFRPKEDTNKSIIPFKTQVRSNITQSGYTIIASIGDQGSDLTGGYADKVFKLPNPYYYLP
jgi:predicted secreted acid phosphatase